MPGAAESPKSSQQLRAAVTSLETELARLRSPAERAARTTRFLAELAEVSRAVAVLRQEPVRELRESGLSFRTIAKLLDLSETAVVQIDRDRQGRQRWRPRPRED